MKSIAASRRQAAQVNHKSGLAPGSRIRKVTSGSVDISGNLSEPCAHILASSSIEAHSARRVEYQDSKLKRCLGVHPLTCRTSRKVLASCDGSSNLSSQHKTLPEMPLSVLVARRLSPHIGPWGDAWLLAKRLHRHSAPEDEVKNLYKTRVPHASRSQDWIATIAAAFTKIISNGTIARLRKSLADHVSSLLKVPLKRNK